ncbi:winged helix-turn-helix transcriptional regulator [Pseudostreptobacillus sp.]|jgi:putative two component transcriptional regulator, winged helix family
MNILYYTWNDSKYADELKKIGINVNVTNDSELVISELKQNNYTILIIDTISVINYKNLFQHIYDKDITIIPIAITEPNNNFILGDAMTLGLVDYIYDTLTPTQFINKIKGIRYLISKEKNDSPNVLLKIKDLTYNTSTREAKRGNEEFSLTLKEGKLLEMLIANKNNVVSREEIFEKIWEKDNVQDKNIGDVYITFLRRKLDNKFEDKLIKTVRNVGYMIKE